MAEVGQVTGDGFMRVRDQGTVVAEIPKSHWSMRPPLQSPAFRRRRIRRCSAPGLRVAREPLLPNAAFMSLPASPTVASKRWVYGEYDHMVRTNTIVLAGIGAAVVRIKGTNKALAMTVDCNSRYCLLHLL